VEKLDKGKAKGGAAIFMTNLLKQLEGDLSMTEVAAFEKLLGEILREKKMQKSSDAKDNKANTKLSKTTKFNAASEWEEVYGGGDGDEDWTQEEWDEWNKKEGAAGGKW